MFLKHVNDSPAFWMPLVTSAGFTWASPYVLEHMKKINLTLVRILYQFRPTPCFPPATDAFCLWVAVKSVTHHTTLCVATSAKNAGFSLMHTRWCFEMALEWRSNRSSVVKEHVVSKDGLERSSDRWLFQTSIELYMWSKIGMTKIGTVEIGVPNDDAFDATNFIADRIFVNLTSDSVTVGVCRRIGHIFDVIELDEFDKYSNPLNYPPIFNYFAKTGPLLEP